MNVSHRTLDRKKAKILTKLKENLWTIKTHYILQLSIYKTQTTWL
jgi:hypothetical protein